MKVDDLKQGFEAFRDRLGHGFAQLRQSAAGALTRFKADEKTQLPPSSDIDLPPALAHPGWALLGGDVFEDERRVVVRLELPGMSREDLDLQLTPELLTVRGQKRFDRESTEGRWRVMQCAYGQFERQVALPVPVKTDEVRAVYKDGVLKVECPKAEAGQPRSVAVQVS